MGTLDGKVALITGGGQGIGRGIVRRFANEGASLVIADISEEHGLAAEAEVRSAGRSAIFIRADVAHKAEIIAAVSAAISQFGRIDILVNNAGKVPVPVPLELKTDSMLEQTMAVSLWGCWWGMQAVLPHMRNQGGGRIINFVSVDLETGAWLHADHCVAKAGVQGLTRAAAMDWARYGILVNALAPVAASAAYEKMIKERPEFEERATASVPLGRLGDPEHDIAPVALFLASEDARYVTGVTLPVDGGFCLQPAPTKPSDLSVFDQFCAADRAPAVAQV